MHRQKLSDGEKKLIMIEVAYENRRLEVLRDKCMQFDLVQFVDDALRCLASLDLAVREDLDYEDFKHDS
jgi:hypothetical protein